MKLYIKKCVYYLLDFAASLWLGVLTMVLFRIPILLIIEENELIDRLLVAILDMLGVALGIIITSMREGYRVRKFNRKMIFTAVICVFVVHNVISPFWDYIVYVGGPATFFAQAIQFGNNIKLRPETTSPILTHFCMVGLDMLLLPLFFLGEYMGVALRNRHNKKLHENKFDPKEPDRPDIEI